jgi:ribonuclease P protein component
MALQRVDPVFAALARRRPEVSSEHFAICTLSEDEVERLQSLQGPGSPCESDDHAAATRGLYGHRPADPHGTDHDDKSVRLGFSVPKRQLARAVDRNAVRRVAREAWRHAGWNSDRMSSAAGGQMARAAGGRGPAAAMIKLRRADPAWREIGRPALRKLWRKELDQLLARLVHRLNRQVDQGDQRDRGRQAK